MKGYRKHKFTRKFYIVTTVLMFICICSVLYYKTVQLEKEELRYQQELEKAAEKYTKEEERSQQVENHRAFVQTKKFAEEFARENFGMGYPDEIRFVPKKIE